MTSAAGAADFPIDRLSEIALVGRSNVGKSSLINALVRCRVARTSGAPGKTRLANIYRVLRGTSQPLYLVDLPGYGYARGKSGGEFEKLARAYFGREGQVGRAGPLVAALLLLDARHPGLDTDVAASHWLRSTVDRVAMVATKIDKLAHGERIRAMRELESVFEDSVLPVSAVTGEGLDELWKLIDKLANSQTPQTRRSSSPNRPPGATAPHLPRRASPPRKK